MEAFRMRQFAKAKEEPNTFIGGIAKQDVSIGVNAPIDTPFKLANKLEIEVNRITGFKVIGNNVQCRIRGEYGIASFGSSTLANANQNITSYIDEDSLVTSQSGVSGFANCKQLTYLKLNGIVTAKSMFRACDHPDLEVEMLSLENTTSQFFAQLNDNFTQTKLHAGFPVLKDLGLFAFHTVNGFTELNLPTVTRIRLNAFYGVYNCVNYYLNNVTNAQAGSWTVGNSACRLIEMKKCKTVGVRFFSEEGDQVQHPTNFTMRLNIAIKNSTAVTDTKTRFPWTVIEFYDDSGNYVETI